MRSLPSDPAGGRRFRVREPRAGSLAPALTLRDPADVLAAIPYLVGFHPADSLVIVGLFGTQLHVTLRIDLPTAKVVPGEIDDIADDVCATLMNLGVTAVVLAGFGPDDRVRPLVTRVRRRCVRGGLDIVDSLRADGGRFWSYACPGAGAARPEGRPYDPHTGVVAATATFAGRPVLPSLDAYRAQLDPVPPTAAGRAAARAAQQRMAALGAPTSDGKAINGPPSDDRANGDRVTGGRDPRRAVVRAGQQAISAGLATVRAGRALDDADIAWLAVLTISAPVRDIAIRLLTRRRADTEADRVRLWLDVLRRCGDDHAMAPGCLFALAAWRGGDTTLARFALERVLRLDPGCRARTGHLQRTRSRPLADRRGGVRPTAPARPARDPAGRRRSSSRRAGSRPA